MRPAGAIVVAVGLIGARCGSRVAQPRLTQLDVKFALLAAHAPFRPPTPSRSSASTNLRSTRSPSRVRRFDE